MARRRKHRTHNKGPAPPPGSEAATPKSFIIKHGQVGPALSALVRDMRKVMEPNTATRLRERTRNKLKDYLTLAPSLSVSHILLFTLTPKSPYLRIIRTPAGPTATFRIERYSTIADIRTSKRKPRGEGTEYRTPPLMVLSKFPVGDKEQPQLGLVAKLLQSLFPPLSPLTLKPSSARRVVLLSYSAGTGTIQLRHYIITIRSFGVSRRVRKLLRPGLDLGNVKDVADFILNEDGYESASSVQSEGEEIDLPSSSLAPSGAGGRVGWYKDRARAEGGDGESVRSGGAEEGRKRAVRLEEVGPRMELRLVKIAEGVPGKEGAVIFHEFVHKTEQEKKAQEKEVKERERIRRERRVEQERNVARKKAERGETAGDDEDNDDEDDEEDGQGEEDDEDAVPDGEDEGDEEDWEDDIEEAERSADESTDDDEDEEEEARPPPPKRAKARR